MAIKEKKEGPTTAAELLTEEQFEKKLRQRNKEKLNRITRVAGTLAIIFIVYVGILDPLFEMSFFGFLFARTEYTNIWNAMSGTWGIVNLSPEAIESIKNSADMSGLTLSEIGNGTINVVSIYDNATGILYDTAMIFAKLGFTVLIISVVVLIVYFITYNIVDLITVGKNMIMSAKNITQDLSGNVKATMDEKQLERFTRKTTPKKSLFSKDEVKKISDIDTEKKDLEKPKRRKESDSNFGLEGYTSDELDILLSGGSLEDKEEKEEETSNPSMPPIL